MPGDASPSFGVDLAEGGRLVVVRGVIDERADLGFLAAVAGGARINLKGVRRINSVGVRSWMDAMRRVRAGTELELVECPPPVVDQLNMVAGFQGRAKITSFFAPMACDRCDIEEDRLFVVEECVRAGRRLPATPCARCGGAMELNDLEEQYLAFLRE